MKRNVPVSLLLVLTVLFGFHGVALGTAGGPGGGEQCSDDAVSIPATEGPYLLGTFSAAYDKSESSDGHVDVHVTLTRFLKVHLFSFAAGYAEDICELDSQILKESFKRVPCLIGVEQAFGLTGIPVITQIRVLKKDFCSEGYPDAMIEGIVTIRVVPAP